MLAASRLQARYRRLRDAIGTGEIGLHFAIGKTLKGFGALVRGESSRTTEAHATGLGTRSAVAGTGEDQLAFEFSQAGKNSHHQAAMRAGQPRALARDEEQVLERVRAVHCSKNRTLMSCLGQYLTSPDCLPMSALLLKADKAPTRGHVRFMP